jgi:hypothetical protein
MLHAGLDLSRRRLDVCLLDGHGEVVAEGAVPADADGLRGLAGRLAGRRVRAVIESMNGARFVHDTLEEHAWDVLIADAQKVNGPAPLACKTDRIDARVLAELSWRDLVPAIWLPDPAIRRERELARFRLHLVRHRTTLKNRIRATLITFGHPCPVSDLFGLAGRAARPPSDPRPVARNRRRQPRADRRSRAADRHAHRAAQAHGRRPSLYPVAGRRSRCGVDQRVHDRLGDRRHRTLRLAGQTVRLYRAMPEGDPGRVAWKPGTRTPARPTAGAPATRPSRTARVVRARRPEPVLDEQRSCTRAGCAARRRRSDETATSR